MKICQFSEMVYWLNLKIYLIIASKINDMQSKLIQLCSNWMRFSARDAPAAAAGHFTSYNYFYFGSQLHELYRIMWRVLLTSLHWRIKYQKDHYLFRPVSLKRTLTNFCYSQPVWPNLANFRQFGNILKTFGEFLGA